MKTNTSFRLPRIAATCFPLLGALILATASNSAMSQDASSTTTTVTTQPVPVSPASSTTTVTTQPVPVSPPASTLQTTTVTTVVPTSLYISKRHGHSLHDGGTIYTRPDGKVYNNDGDYIGHLTNLEGSDISALPVRDEFKIRNSNGTIIASTRPSSAFDSDRKVFLSRKDGPAPVTTTSSTTTMRQTTTAQ